jgi:hypothetical protein
MHGHWKKNDDPMHIMFAVSGGEGLKFDDLISTFKFLIPSTD